jgi:hypothetical protein
MDPNVTHKLDVTQKQKVSYCIPLWLRDEQIKVNLARVPGRVEGAPPGTTRPEPIAVVCYGPSLAEEWERVRDFQHIISCSGSHKFLIERGIIPTWHVEVDPRKHKITLMGAPHPDVEYLIASTCHPKLLDHLEGFKVKLWHVFDNEAEALRTLPAGEWAITGGCSVGLRAMAMARFFGFTDLHVFGMDGSDGKTGKHAAAHPNQAPAALSAEVEYNGRTYLTTPGFLEAARQTWHELDQMPDVTATFYGDGLVQAMARDYQRKPPIGKTTLAVAKEELISAEYAALNAQLHRENLAYGVGGGKYAKTVLKLAASINSHSILDYGCGKGYLAKEIPFPIWEYDPAVPGKTESPRPADIVACLDVLEHIEPEKLTLVLDDLWRCTKRLGYFVIHTGPSTKVLADGRNAHLIQEDHHWWRKRLERFFRIAKVWDTPPLLHMLVEPKTGLKPKLQKVKVQG